MARHVPAALLFGALTVVLTWPLLAAITTNVPHDAGDPMLSTWTLWWNARVVPFSSAWWNGPFFYPETDTLTLSDHRVGLSLIATPLIHLGASPLTAQNVLFVLSYPLSAMAAYALCYDLTRSRGAAVVGGLVFGFNPFRASHLPHLELLCTWWLPLILLSLHRWARTGTRWWLVVLALSLTLQAITSGYYFVFAGVLVGLWLIWFMPPGWPLAGRGESPHGPLARYAELGIALAAPLVAITPVVWRYREAHAAMGLSRSITEIEDLSADLIGLLTPPEQLFLWDAPAAWYNPEGDIFPGATAVLLVAAALWAGRQTAAARPWYPRWRTALLGLASVAALVALTPLVFGPIAFALGSLRVSVTDPYKPLTVAAVLIAMWALTTARLRQAWRQRSLLAFYCLATVAMWLFALGPTARVLGERVLYKAPYAWLMQVPGVGAELRAPARFAMLAALTLAVAAALSFQRLAPARRWARTPALALVCIAIMAESWIHPFPIARAPSPLEVPGVVPIEAVIMELPIGVFEDAAAMYRATLHERPIVNGMSGYTPPIHQKVSAALEKGNVRPIAELAVDRPIAIFVVRGTGDELAAALLEQTPAQVIATTASHQVLLMPARKN
jgi:hypothetical protein